MNTLETLKAMDALLCSPDRWTQGWYAKDAGGNNVQEKANEAFCWCLIGASRKVSDNLCPALEATSALYREIGSESILVQVWNDAPNRTFAEVKDLLARAIAEESK